MSKWLVKFSLAVAVLAGMAAGGAQAQDTLAKIKEKGVIAVGVKNDYKPWGYLDPSGKIVGMETDLVADIAAKLGVKTELLPVIAANRMEFLNQGRIDIILATMGDTTDRRKVVGMIEPNYYAGGTNVLAPKTANLKNWADLQGKKVCAVQGAYYNRRVTQLYKPDLVVLPAVPDALNSLNGGNCVAFLFDNTLIEFDALRRRRQMGRLRNAVGVGRPAAVGHGRAFGRSQRAVRRVLEEAERRLASDRQASRAREEMGHQGQPVSGGNARQA